MSAEYGGAAGQYVGDRQGCRYYHTGNLAAVLLRHVLRRQRRLDSTVGFSEAGNDNSFPVLFTARHQWYIWTFDDESWPATPCCFAMFHGQGFLSAPLWPPV